MAKLPEGWVVADLGEFCEGIRGVTYKPDDLAQINTEKTITLLRSNNIKAGALNFKDVQHVAQKNVNQKQIAQLGDIAVCMSNGSKRLVGKSAAFKYIPEGHRYTVGSFCSIFRPLKSACPVFVEQVFCSDQFQKQVDFSLAGSAINNLKNSDLITYQFLKPPVPEQQKIATILSSVDDVIEKTRAQIDKLKDLKTGMMQELLTKGIGHTEFKDSPVGRIPVGWNVVRLSEVITLNYGKSPKDIISESGSNSVWGTGGVTAKTDIFLYDGESIILGRKGTIDQPRYVSGKFWVIDTAYFSTNHGDNSVRFLHYLLQRINLKSLNEASGVPSLNRDTLYSVSVAMPTPSEQKDIADIVYSIEEKTLLMVNKNKALLKVKKALMQDLLTGRVRVNLPG